MKKVDAKAIVDNLIALQRAYSFTFRVLITEERYRLVESGSLQEYTFESESLREPLIEHVGHLPIIASYLHPYIAHEDEVDLGRVLIMLSIHDIGETVVGDMLTYSKTDSHAEQEIVQKKSPHFEWDPVLQNIFTYLVERYRAIEEGR